MIIDFIAGTDESEPGTPQEWPTTLELSGNEVWNAHRFITLPNNVEALRQFQEETLDQRSRRLLFLAGLNVMVSEQLYNHKGNKIANYIRNEVSRITALIYILSNSNNQTLNLAEYVEKLELELDSLENYLLAEDNLVRKYWKIWFVNEG